MFSLAGRTGSGHSCAPALCASAGAPGVVSTVCARLSQPDAAALLAPDVDLDAIRAEVVDLRARRDGLAEMLAEGLLSPAKAKEQARKLTARIETADRVVDSICPFCAVGCGQRVYVKDEKVVQIEGNPDSPISRGRLCPKGSASLQLTTGDAREKHVLYRRPHGTDWERLDLETAMDMIANRIVETRAANWEAKTDNGAPANRTMAIGNLGGATLDNEENYLIKKLMTALGVVQVENQARI